ncbi:MAG: type II secretion system major pseudopilin GspG [Thiolinea sp.]
MKNLNNTRRRRHKAASGYTLMELLIVITIIGVLLSIAVVNLRGTPDEARISAARQELRTMELALDLYRMHNAAYPTNDQGLKALVEKPAEARKWQTGGYLKGKSVPVDPWGNPYRYLSPGNHGELDIYSLGPDGRESEDDIGNWALEE